LFSWITPFIKYLRYVVLHKIYVFEACVRMGITLAGITHDFSKFFPDEFIPYARYFNGPRAKTRTQTPQEKADFDLAWLKHQRRSGHHWQAWILHEDSGAVKLLDMPDRYRREMIADWQGAGRMFGKTDTAAWYLKNRDHILLAPLTRAWVESKLGIVK
jgi:hypothetical protein